MRGYDPSSQYASKALTPSLSKSGRCAYHLECMSSESGWMTAYSEVIHLRSVQRALPNKYCEPVLTKEGLALRPARQRFSAARVVQHDVPQESI